MVELADMKFFVRAVACGSLSAAGRELGFSPAVASKRLTRMENELGVRLLQRNSRRLGLTPEGALYVERCRQILADVEEAENLISNEKHEVQGTLHVSCPVALGRRCVGAAITSFAKKWPGVRVRLSLSDSIDDLLEGGFDCAIRIGGSEDSRLIGRKLADNFRIVCAAPSYLAERGYPRNPEELNNHSAIILSEQFNERADWKFIRASDKQFKSVSIPVRMATNNGDQAHDWAMAGVGLIRRSIWDVKKEIESGQLIHLLPEWHSEPATIRVVFPSRQFLPARTRLFIDYLAEFFKMEEVRLNSGQC
ncbi:MAG: LysR family transcriptional regulator [Gammaproteobacteria bacterium]|nr:MAG: LysR family transcriptional regulator [Gammaproteobacteria bacterium]